MGPPDDAATGRLLVMRSSAIVSAWDDYDRSGADAARALDLAREAGDPILELDALTISARIQIERGDPHAYEVWEGVEKLARQALNWEKVSAAARIQATRDLEDSPDEVVLRLGAARGVADAYGLVEDAPGVTTGSRRPTWLPGAGTRRSQRDDAHWRSPRAMTSAVWLCARGSCCSRLRVHAVARI